MGACDFTVIETGKTADIAFRAARDHAQYMNGHGGYTGTIAEKHDFTVIKVPEGADPAQFAQKLMDDHDDRISNKWGPAGCVYLGDDRWVFFGWASS